MKKNKMMRLASALLVAVLLSTSVISGTYAKYVTTDSNKDTARVAKWGVVVTTEGNSLFSSTYSNVATTEKHMEDGVEVLDKLVAPGTDSGSGVEFTITGTPEVATKVTISMTDVEDVFLAGGLTLLDPTTGNATDTFTTSTNTYYPVKFTLYQGGSIVDGCENVTLATIQSKLNTINEVEHAAGTNLSTVYGTYTLTWAWAFDADASKIDLNDQMDTVLGNLAVNPSEAIKSGAALGSSEFSTVVKFNIKITVEQVD